MTEPAPSTTLKSLSQMVVKDAVGIGSLPPAGRNLALACVWVCLPQQVLTEAQLNDHLRQALAGAACWLRTDHVELRRWLVDMGWVGRDGYGRAYQRVALTALPPALRPLADLLADTLTAAEMPAWVAAARQQHQRARLARRQAWQSAA